MRGQAVEKQCFSGLHEDHVLGTRNAKRSVVAVSRGQASAEVIVVVLIITLALIALLPTYTGLATASDDHIGEKEARVAVDQIAAGAQSVWAQGVGARVTVPVALPETTQSLSYNGKRVILNYSTSGGERSVYYVLPFNITGNTTTPVRSASVKLEATSNGVIARS